jgi:hypothetical protein
MAKLMQDAKNYAIIIYYTLVPIPYEGIIFNHIIMFHKQDKTKQTLYWGQLGWSPKSVM